MSRHVPLLTRAQHGHIKRLLRECQHRQADGTFVIEGAKAVRELLNRSPSSVRSVVTTPEYRAQESPSDRRLREAGTWSSYSSSATLFDKLSDVGSPQGVLAVVSQPRWDEQRILAQPCLLGVFGDRLQDPLNVGGIIRTAAALGVDALWLTRDSADPFHPKVVRAAAGALWLLPLFYTDEPSDFLGNGCALFAAEVPGPGVTDLADIEQVPSRLILALGSEGQGLSAEVQRLAARRFAIPMHRQMDSLNVAATMAIATYHFSRLPKES